MNAPAAYFRTTCVFATLARFCFACLFLACFVCGAAQPATLLPGLQRQVYTNIPGPGLDFLRSSPKFPDHPDLVDVVSSFETPTDAAENYGQRLTGFLLPPVTGDYVFYLSSDDQSALYLSPDTEATNMVRIAWEPTWAPSRSWTGLAGGRTNQANISAPIHLEAGHKYYVEAQHKEAWGGDCFGVAWRLPGGLTPANGDPPISVNYLAHCASQTNEPPVVWITIPTNGAVFNAGADVLLGAMAGNPANIQRLAFFTNGAFLGLGTGPSRLQNATHTLMWSNVPPGSFTLTAQAVTLSDLTATSPPVQISVRTNPPPLERELHTIGIYSGNVGDGASRTNEEGQASLVVNRPGKRVTLFLSAYEPVLWSVIPTNGTVIEKVILAGYYAQRVQGLGAETEIVPDWFLDRTNNFVWLGYSLDSGEFYQAVPHVHSLTGLEILSFHGAYTAPYPTPFVIDSIQDDPRLRSDYPQPTPLDQLPNLNFRVAFWGGGSAYSVADVFFIDYTLGGPLNGAGLLAGLRLVPDAGQRFYYTATMQEALKVDSQTGTAEAMDLGPDVPPLNWPMGMAYDSIRNREFLVSLGGEGFLYAYAPQSNRWSLVSSMGNRDLACLVYHANQDALYGMEVYRSGYDLPVLDRFSVNGSYQGQITLPVLPHDVGIGDWKPELVAVGEYLVLLLAPDPMINWFAQGESRMYLIDPRSGQVWLTYRQIPNQAPTVAITAPVEGAAFATGGSIALKAEAQDSEGYVRSVEFFANYQSLGLGYRLNSGPYYLLWTNTSPGSYTLTAKATDDRGASTVSAPVHIAVTNQPGLGTQPVAVWIRQPTSSSRSDDWPTAITTDTQGNVYVTGPEMGSTYLDYHYATIKYTPDGTQAWLGRYDGASTFYDFATANAVDDQDNLYVTGYSYGGSNQYDMVTMKYDVGRNTNLWIARYDGPLHDNDYGIGLHVDALHNVYVGGYSTPYLDAAFVMLKYNADGQLLWRGSYRVPGYGFHNVNAVAVDPAGNSYLAGQAQVIEGPTTFLVVKFDPNGNVAWASAYDGPARQGSWASALAVDPAGNVYASGTRIDSAMDNTFVTIKYGPNGNQLWTASYKGPQPGYHYVSQLKLDKTGHLYLTGGVPGRWVANQGYLYDVATLKYDLQGKLLWAARYHGEGTQSEFGSDLALDASGNAFVAGTVCNGGTSNDIATIKYDVSGNLLWLARYDGPAHSQDWKPHLALDSGGAILMTCAATGPQSGLDWATIKYIQTNASSLPFIITQPSGGQFMRGATAALSVTAGGPNLTYQWRFNGVPILNASNATLVLTNIQTGQAGDYSVEVHNAAGWTASPEARLTVIEPLVLSWATPAPVRYGTLLSASQLNATATVAGTFVYTPPAGTLLNAGSNQLLSVVFTPQNTQVYSTLTGHVTLDVLRAALTIVADDKMKIAGAPNPPLTATYCGLVAGDTPASLDTPLTLTTTATVSSPPGSYPIIASGVADANYSITLSNGTLMVREIVTTPGSLDLAFDVPLNHWARIGALARQSDGKLLIGGWFTTTGPVLRTNIARLNPDGSIDPSFHTGLFAEAEVHSVVVQPDGKILVGSSSAYYSNAYHFGLTRVLADGSKDETFHNGVTDNEEDWGGVRSIILQPDGRILIGGMFSTGGREILARLDANGVDPSFDAGDIYVWESDDDVVRDLLLQSSGKIIARGDISKVQGAPVQGIFRLQPDGLLDRSFGTNFGNLTATCLQPDDKVLLGGFLPLNSMWGIMRLNADGTFDTSFRNNNPRVQAPSAMAVQTDGKIIAASSFWTNNSRFTPVRLFAGGALDPGFDSGRGANSQVFRILIEPAGSIIVAGCFTEFDGVPRYGIARLNNDNPVPPSFVLRSFTGNTVQLSAQPQTNVNVYAVEDRPPAGWPVLNLSHGGVWDTNTGKVKFGPFFDAEPRALTYVVFPPPGTQGVFPFNGQASADGVSTRIGGAQAMVLAGPHPADLAPQDWRLNIDEVTAYGAAWRTGGMWSVEPNPIPISYVTRAGALWQGGESYGLNTAGPPMCWINTNRIRPLALTEESISACRRLAKGYIPGEPIDITIEVLPGAGVGAYALEESVPAGWQISGITQGGVIDAVHHQLKWGPFFDSASRTFRYQLLPPTATTALLAFTGNASANGHAVAIDGPAQLPPSSRLTYSWQPGDGHWSLQLRGASGATYLIETSTDLIHWEAAATLTNSSGVLEIPTPVTPDARQRFYRSRLAP